MGRRAMYLSGRLRDPARVGYASHVYFFIFSVKSRHVFAGKSRCTFPGEEQIVSSSAGAQQLAPIEEPRAEYSRRRDLYQALAARQARLYRRIANLRVVFVALAVLCGWAASGGDRTAAALLILPVMVFPLLVFWQNERVSRAHRRAVRAADYYERGLARLEDRWMGTGQPGMRFLDEDHPCALDLDLFGKGSLFERLCTARTSRGEDTLAAWLRAPAPPDDVRARQEAVEELRQRLDLREALALLADGVPAGANLDALVAWGSAAPLRAPRWARPAALFLPALTVLALIGWLVLDQSGLPFVVLLMLELVFALWLHARVHQVIAPVERRARDLGLLAGILARLKHEDFKSTHLGVCVQPLTLPVSRPLGGSLNSPV